MIFYIFLPILIFESALNLPVYVFSKVIWQCILLAGPGLLLAMFLTAVCALCGPRPQRRGSRTTTCSRSLIPPDGAQGGRYTLDACPPRSSMTAISSKPRVLLQSVAA